MTVCSPRGLVSLRKAELCRKYYPGPSALVMLCLLGDADSGVWSAVHAWRFDVFCVQTVGLAGSCLLAACVTFRDENVVNVVNGHAVKMSTWS